MLGTIKLDENRNAYTDKAIIDFKQSQSSRPYNPKKLKINKLLLKPIKTINQTKNKRQLI